MPVEQWHVSLHEVTEQISEDGTSFTPFGFAHFYEFFYLSFRAVCAACGHIDLWAIEHEEVQAIIEKSRSKDNEGYGINWHYDPQSIAKVLERAKSAEKLKSTPQFLSLLEDLLKAIKPEGEKTGG